MSLRIHGRRAISSPKGLHTRPTGWRIRQALFDRAVAVEDAAWLDVCCGVGTIGAEALGRGARLVVGIDASKQAAALTRRNWEKVKHETQEIRVVTAHAATAIRRLRDRFDVVYLDPPYESDVYEAVLPLLADVLAPGGQVFVEHDKRRLFPDTVDGLHIVERRTYGDTTLSVYAAADRRV